jgi:hypothetical protein
MDNEIEAVICRFEIVELARMMVGGFRTSNVIAKHDHRRIVRRSAILTACPQPHELLTMDLRCGSPAGQKEIRVSLKQPELLY